MHKLVGSTKTIRPHKLYLHTNPITDTVSRLRTSIVRRQMFQ